MLICEDPAGNARGGKRRGGADSGVGFCSGHVRIFPLPAPDGELFWQERLLD